MYDRGFHQLSARAQPDFPVRLMPPKSFAARHGRSITEMPTSERF